MSRLFSRTNATAIDDPEFGHFAADPDHGGFDLPDELSDRLHPFHHRGKPAWETEIEREERLHGEDSARRRDPQTLYNAVEGIAALVERLAAVVPAGSPASADGDVARLTAEVEALKAQLAEAQADPAEDEAAKKPAAARSRRTAAAA